jgi:chromosome partitioning protein
VALANQKGGVGKTTTAVHLGKGLAMAGKRVLLIDADPQGNATTHLGIKKEPDRGTSAALQQPARMAEEIRAVSERFDLLPGHFQLRQIDGMLSRTPDGARRFRQGLETLSRQYDFALIDCPPALGMLTVNALSASSYVVVPIQAEYLALEGLAQMYGAVGQVQKGTHPGLRWGGILLTMVEPSAASPRGGRAAEVLRQVESELDKHFPGLRYEATVPRDPRIAESPSHGQSIFEYAPRSLGAFGYARVVMETMNRIF